MLAEVRETVGLFERRFVFNAMLPVAVFGVATITAVLAFNDSLVPFLRWIDGRSGMAQGIAALLAFATCWMAGGILASQWRNLVRLFEGYPLVAAWPRLPVVGDRPCPGTKHHQNRRYEIDQRDADEFYMSYCSLEFDVLPTRFGNILLAAERYPYERYGVDPILFWPRLFPSLPDHFRDDYGVYVMAYEFPLVVGALSVLCGTVVAWASIWARASYLWFALILTSSWTVAYFFYLSACSAAAEWGEQLRTAFDLYRTNLLLLYPDLDSIPDERTKFDALSNMIRLGEPGQTSSLTSDQT